MTATASPASPNSCEVERTRVEISADEVIKVNLEVAQNCKEPDSRAELNSSETDDNAPPPEQEAESKDQEKSQVEENMRYHNHVQCQQTIVKIGIVLSSVCPQLAPGAKDRMYRPPPQ